MKTVIVFLSFIIATSFIRRGIIRCAIYKRHYSFPFLTRNDKEIYDKLIQSKDEMLKSKDETLKSKDETIHILTKSNDEILKLNYVTIKSKDETLKSKDEALSSANAEILHLQGRLSLRSVFEQFELRYEGLLDPSVSTKGDTKREKVWKAIIENNAGGIMQHLGDTTTDWPLVAKSLYKLMSKDIHNYTSKKVIINDISLTDEMTKLAVTVCKMFPIKFEIISPSPLSQE